MSTSTAQSDEYIGLASNLSTTVNTNIAPDITSEAGSDVTDTTSWILSDSASYTTTEGDPSEPLTDADDDETPNPSDAGSDADSAESWQSRSSEYLPQYFDRESEEDSYGIAAALAQNSEAGSNSETGVDFGDLSFVENAFTQSELDVMIDDEIRLLHRKGALIQIEAQSDQEFADAMWKDTVVATRLTIKVRRGELDHELQLELQGALDEELYESSDEQEASEDEQGSGENTSEPDAGGEETVAGDAFSQEHQEGVKRKWEELQTVPGHEK